MYEFSDSAEAGQECKGIIFERYVSESDIVLHRETQRDFDMNSQWTGGDLVAKKVTKWTESGIGHSAPSAAPPRGVERTAEDLRTPALVVSLPVVQRNATRMLARAAALGCALRPHVKTHKTVEIAMLQTGGRRSRITVSSLASAAFFMDAGWDDILYAVPITADKLDDARALSNRIEFHVLVDNAHQLDAIVAAAPPATGAWNVWVMCDCGYKRDGVDCGSDAALALVRRIEASGRTALRGMYTHGGHSYGAATRDAIEAIGGAERDAVVAFAARCGVAGDARVAVAVGSTPTCSRPPRDGLEGVSEMHPGNYIYNDVMQLRICSIDSVRDIAPRVVTRVIGHYPQHATLLIDCGWTGCSAQGATRGYGLIEGHPELAIKVLKQEAGEVEVALDADGTSVSEEQMRTRYPIGTLLSIVPWHACAATAMHRTVYATDERGVIVGEYAIARGW
jgi:D-serine deaminase-like pyridoxal phosphate-dependent protein